MKHVSSQVTSQRERGSVFKSMRDLSIFCSGYGCSIIWTDKHIIYNNEGDMNKHKDVLIIIIKCVFLYVLLRKIWDYGWDIFVLLM